MRRVVRETVSGWIDHRASSLGAALAYYTAFSLAPLLLIAIAVAGLWVDSDVAARAIADQAAALLGPRAAQGVEFMLHAAPHAAQRMARRCGRPGDADRRRDDGADRAAVRPRHDLARAASPLKRRGRRGVVAAAVVRLDLCIGFLFLASLVVSTALSALAAHGDRGSARIAGGADAAQFAGWGIVLTLGFALLFKWLPNVHLAWSDVLPARW